MLIDTLIGPTLVQKRCEKIQPVLYCDVNTIPSISIDIVQTN